MYTPLSGIRFGALVGAATLALGCQSSIEPRTGAAAIILEEGGEQGANVGTALTVSPVVRVVTSARLPVAGVRVNFTLSSGGGTITGATATTDENGLAALGSWTIGSVGENQLIASAAGVPPLVISAVGRCVAGSSLAVNGLADGDLATGDCRYANGEFTDRYAFTTATQRGVRFTQTSDAVNSFLELQGPGNVIAFNNDITPASAHSGFKVLLAPGAYDVNPSSFSGGELGAYTIEAAAVPENESGCDIVFAVPEITTDQALANDDCASNTFRYDSFALYLHAGRSYTFTMNSLVLDSYLELLDYGTERVVANNDDISQTNLNARITFVPTVSTFYLLIASHAEAGSFGTYTLMIDIQ